MVLSAGTDFGTYDNWHWINQTGMWDDYYNIGHKCKIGSRWQIWKLEFINTTREFDLGTILFNKQFSGQLDCKLFKTLKLFKMLKDVEVENNEFLFWDVDFLQRFVGWYISGTDCLKERKLCMRWDGTRSYSQLFQLSPGIVYNVTVFQYPGW